MADNEDKKKIDVQGLIRTGITIAAVIGAVYYWQGKIDSHVANSEIHQSTTQLADTFVLRREYDSNVAALRDDIKWVKSEMVRISNKIDRLAERGQK